MNPLFNQMQGQRGQQGGIAGMIQKFNQFRQQFTGDPEQEVQRLLQSGKMSQEQLNQLQADARALQSFFQ